MTEAAHDLANRFFTALSAGSLPDDLLTDDMTAWTTSSGENWAKEKYQGGVKLVGSIFNGGATYVVDSLTAEDNRVAAEVHAHGTLVDGQVFENRYVFILQIRDSKIASVAEHFNPGPVMEKMVPLIQAALAKAKG